ncbi:hypothetical protein E1B28_002718 [Marasmius oreades]|uniref:Protein kinase domain-containing protein n=1 Tax=Marasmius oreades TaxID=181124 RepID=A0A9P7RNJ9_9AGAR|nr:uncharacterized protein E1B28_002718 [Marasmius oreades]KAG7086790.1 hypothetical protein E1B28_002718 [Marasmius oreades]
MDRRHGSEPASLSKSPYSNGTASDYEEEFYTHTEIHHLLHHDIMSDKQVDLDVFMSTVLHAPNPLPSTEVKVIDEIVKSPEFIGLLEDYCKPVVLEEEKYLRFTRLCRYAIAQMVEKKITKNELGFALCVNDFRSSGGHRKPDVVGTTYKAINIRFREGKYETNDNNDNNHKTDRKKRGNGETVESQSTVEDASTTLENIIDTITSPPTFPLMWNDLYMFAEFKVGQYDQRDIEEPVVGASQPVPTSSSTVSVPRRSNKQSNQVDDTQLTDASIFHHYQTNGVRRSHGTSRGVSTAGPPLAPSDSNAGGSGDSTPPARGNSTKRRRDDDDSVQAVEPPPKRRKVMIPPNIRVECAGYARHLFNRGGVRTHVIGALVTNNVLELLVYTRSGSCFTKPLKFIKNPSLFLSILLAFSRLTWSQWGFFDRLIPCTLSTPQLPGPNGETDLWMFKGCTLDVGENKCEVSDIRMFPRDLIGRGTWTIGMMAKSKELLGEGKVRKLILKISSAPTTREPEQFFLDKASTAANEDAKEKWVLNHLPEMIDSGDFEGTVSFEQLFGEDYEKRTLRYLAVEELYPITDLTAPEELRLAFKDIVYCHQWLVTVPGIMHRDVSINNLMFRVKGDRKFGVLNDFDLACTLDEDHQSSSKQRTGTKPFIARDLLTPAKESDTLQKHFVRYDLESMVYVFAWIICRYEDGREIRNPPFEGWCKGNLVDVGHQKSDWMHGSVERQPITPQYESLRRILESLRTRLRRGYNAQDEYLAPDFPSGLPPFKHETLGDHVTYSTILAALDPPPPYTDALAALS